MNAVKEISQALVAIESELVEKLDAQPKMHISLAVGQSGDCWIHIYGSQNYDAIHLAKGGTFAECISDARAYIAALPDPDERVSREYLSKVADAIDFGTKHSIDDKYVTPLRGVTKAMTDNLLTKEPAE